MRYTAFIVLLVMYMLESNALEYVYDAYGDSTQKQMIFADKSKYVHLETEGKWTDSLGDYGLEFCYGKIEIVGDDIALDIFCEGTNQKDEKFWVSRKRKSVRGVGSGINKYLSGTGRYEKFSGLECKYGVNFLNEAFWYKQKCEINEKILTP